MHFSLGGQDGSLSPRTTTHRWGSGEWKKKKNNNNKGVLNSLEVMRSASGENPDSWKHAEEKRIETQEVEEAHNV